MFHSTSGRILSEMNINAKLTFGQWRTLREILGGGGGGEIFNMYGVGLRYANLSNIMLGISNSLFDILL